MTRSKLHQCAEGFVVTAAGVLFFALSMSIRDNPVSVEGIINVVIQAKFIPLLLSALITLQGIGLIVSQWKGKEKTVRDGGFTPRALTVALLTMAYLIVASYVGLVVPTVVYIGVLLFVVNRDRKPLQLVALTALYSVIALLVIPKLLNLQLL